MSPRTCVRQPLPRRSLHWGIAWGCAWWPRAWKARRSCSTWRSMIVTRCRATISAGHCLRRACWTYCVATRHRHWWQLRLPCHAESRSAFQPVAGAKHPVHGSQAQRQEAEGHAQADADRYVGNAVEAPAKAADQVHHRVEQGELLPEGGQHADRVETAAKEGQRGDNQRRYDLQFLPAGCPEADDEAEQAEGDGRQQQEGHHP